MAAPLEGCYFSAALSCTFLASCLLFSAVGRALREPYMDEVFHLPQAQRFCEGHFSPAQWDPMITTLPGLYLLSVGVVKPLGWLFGWSEHVVCSAGMLRFVNLLLSAGNFYLLYLLLCRLQPRAQAASGAHRVLSALTLALFPTLFFFNFLYYTETGSVFFTLFSYLMCLDGSHKTAAALAFCGVLFRQTNIVWAAFCAGSVLAQRLADAWEAELRGDEAARRGDEAARRAAGAGEEPLAAARRLLRFLAAQAASPRRLGALLRPTWPYLGLALLFGAFVLLNGGVAVGDRASHEACLHAPQLFYFLCFALLFSAPHLLSLRRARAFLRLAWRRRACFCAAALAAALLVRRFTYAHRYLLADNRHYSFYVWRRVFQRHAAARYLLVPLYLFAGWSVARSLRARPLLWNLVFFACLAAATVPQRLLEFRYFVLPYLMYRLHLPPPPAPRLLCELAGYLAVNGLTFHVFLNKPFRWPDSPDAQRFMW